MSLHSRDTRIKGERPWGRNEHGTGKDGRDRAPQQQALYRCAGNRGRPCPHPGGTFTVPLAAGVEPPAALDCRCGGAGVLDGAAEGTEVDLPGYGHPPGGFAKGTRQKEGMDPWGQLLKRGRTEAELAALAAETLARRDGVAR